MLKETLVSDLKLNPITKLELLTEITNRTKSGERTFLTTLYSEFLYHSLRDQELTTLLNRADLAIADGIGVIWAEYFLRKPFYFQNYYLKICEAWLQVVVTGAQILLRPKSLFSVFPEKIVGADLIWDLAALAERENFSVYLFGGFDDTTVMVKEKLEERFPEINIVGLMTGTTQHAIDVVSDIREKKPDILLVAYGRINQERWIVKQIDDAVPLKFVVGLGGSFDYVAGKVALPPRVVRKVGLEWLYRLITQPHRIGRIYQAVWGLISSLVRFKLQEKLEKTA